MLFGAYLDKRELQNSLPGDVHRATAAPTTSSGWTTWPTSATASTRPTRWRTCWRSRSSTVDGSGCPAADALVMGGDQVYPTASGAGVRGPLQGPVPGRAAATARRARSRPTLFAVPGNHDWYDGLTAFLRLFAGREDAHIGGWQTAQTRSYFAVKLPRGWWLFAHRRAGRARTWTTRSWSTSSRWPAARARRPGDHVQRRSRPGSRPATSPSVVRHDRLLHPHGRSRRPGPRCR